MIVRFRSLRSAPNLLIVSLSIAGLLIIPMLPIFLINLYHGGPYTGIPGAKVKVMSIS